jgi:hypothetical protein
MGQTEKCHMNLSHYYYFVIYYYIKMYEGSMAGRFEGVSDLEWRLFADIVPPAPPKRGRGMPHVPFRKILNTLLDVLITGCRWRDVP